MKFIASINGVERSLEIARAAAESGVSNQLRIILDGRPLNLDVAKTSSGSLSILVGGAAYEATITEDEKSLNVQCEGQEFRVELRDPRAWRRAGIGTLEAEGRQQVRAPMPGKVVRVLVAQGDTVEAGQGLVVVEAMKMQNEIRAPKSGVIERVSAQEGQAVGAGETLVIIA
jgi:biotin carboxyl carrier protein